MSFFYCNEERYALVAECKDRMGCIGMLWVTSSSAHLRRSTRCIWVVTLTINICRFLLLLLQGCHVVSVEVLQRVQWLLYHAFKGHIGVRVWYDFIYTWVRRLSITVSMVQQFGILDVLLEQGCPFFMLEVESCVC